MTKLAGQEGAPRGGAAPAGPSFGPQTQGVSFKVLAEISVGATARIDLCRAEGPNRPGMEGQMLAVKRLHPHIAEDPAFAAQFLDEVWMTASLKHPNVVEVRGWGNDSQGAYLAVELVQGVSLSRLMKTVFDTGEVFGERMTMMGGGLQLRFRTQGHFGFETAFDVMRANLADGLFKRTSFPFTAGVMLYLFRNRPETHFNVYAIAGVGLQASDIVLYDDRPGRLNQQFLELLGHVGGGVELDGWLMKPAGFDAAKKYRAFADQFPKSKYTETALYNAMVIGRDGSLTGYAGGLPRKEELLRREGVLLT